MMKSTKVANCFVKFTDTCKLLDTIKTLERNGYYCHPSCFINSSDKYLYVSRGFFANIPMGYEEETKSSIDCGTDLDMFLSICCPNISKWSPIPEDRVDDFIGKEFRSTVVCKYCGKLCEDIINMPYAYDSETKDIIFASKCPHCEKIFFIKE